MPDIPAMCQIKIQDSRQETVVPDAVPLPYVNQIDPGQITHSLPLSFFRTKKKARQPRNTNRSMDQLIPNISIGALAAASTFSMQPRFPSIRKIDTRNMKSSKDTV